MDDLDNLIGDFERIIILKTMICEVNQNFLSVDDLKHIAYNAYDMEVKDFPRYDLEELYNSDVRVQKVYENYFKFVCKEYNRIKNGLMKRCL